MKNDASIYKKSFSTCLHRSRSVARLKGDGAVRGGSPEARERGPGAAGGGSGSAEAEIQLGTSAPAGACARAEVFFHLRETAGKGRGEGGERRYISR